MKEAFVTWRRNSALDNRARQQSLRPLMQRFARHGLRQAYKDGRNGALKFLSDCWRARSSKAEFLHQNFSMANIFHDTLTWQLAIDPKKLEATSGVVLRETVDFCSASVALRFVNCSSSRRFSRHFPSFVSLDTAHARKTFSAHFLFFAVFVVIYPLANLSACKRSIVENGGLHYYAVW